MDLGSSRMVSCVGGDAPTADLTPGQLMSLPILPVCSFGMALSWQTRWPRRPCGLGPLSRLSTGWAAGRVGLADCDGASILMKPEAQASLKLVLIGGGISALIWLATYLPGAPSLWKQLGPTVAIWSSSLLLAGALFTKHLLGCSACLPLVKSNMASGR